MRRIVRTLMLVAVAAGSCRAQIAMNYNRQSGPVPVSYFGMHIGYNCVPGGGCWAGYTGSAPPWPTQFTVGTDRLWGAYGTSWAEINPTSGTYSWPLLDAQVAAGQSNGVTDFVYTFGRTPTWASSNPGDAVCSGNPPYTNGYTNGGCDAPASLSSLTNFANALVQRYCGTIKYYEAWNEPDITSFWNDTAAHLNSMIQAEYAAVHSTANCACDTTGCGAAHAGTNPNYLLSPPIGQPFGYNARFFHTLGALGTGQYFDILSYHGYGYSSGPTSYLGDVSSYRQYMYGLTGAGAAQMWDSEGSYGQQGQLPGIPNQMSWMARTYLTLWPSGISRYGWYQYDNANNSSGQGPWGQMWSSSGIRSATFASGGGGCQVGDVVTVTQGASYAGMLQVTAVSPITLAVYGLGFGYSSANGLATTGGTGCNGSLVVNITAGPGSNALATAYGQLEKWMVGATESCRHYADGGWVCSLARTSPAGYQAYAVWNDNGNASYVVPAGVVQSRDLYGNTTAATPGSVVSLTSTPVLLETASAW